MQLLLAQLANGVAMGSIYALIVVGTVVAMSIFFGAIDYLLTAFFRFLIVR